MEVMHASNVLPLHRSVLSRNGIIKTSFSTLSLLSDSSCQMPSTEGCNVTIQAILAHSGECICIDENPCSILQLLASLCHSYLGMIYSINHFWPYTRNDCKLKPIVFKQTLSPCMHLTNQDWYLSRWTIKAMVYMLTQIIIYPYQVLLYFVFQ